MVKQSSQPAHSVLLTRPKGQGEAFERRLKERFGPDLPVVLSPLMAPRFLSPNVPEGDFAAIIFTSVTGVEAARGLGADLPPLAYCVGRQTAKVAQEAGFQALSADGDAGALVALILQSPPSGPLLHLRGADTAGDLVGRLGAAGLTARDLVVYRQEEQPLTAPACALLMQEGAVILPLFSPRSARLMVKALPEGAKARLYLAALSPAVAEVAARLPHVAMVTAARPDADAMLEAVADLIVAASVP